MKGPDQTIAIAESLGASFWRNMTGKIYFCATPVANPTFEGPLTDLPDFLKYGAVREGIPDFLNSLDAIQKAKDTLSFDEQTEYVKELMLLFKDFPMTDAFFASSRKQCEAYLKAKKLWKN